jgi:hypothetical protein
MVMLVEINEFRELVGFCKKHQVFVYEYGNDAVGGIGFYCKRMSDKIVFDCPDRERCPILNEDFDADWFEFINSSDELKKKKEIWITNYGSEIRVSGKTYEIKDDLKKLGFKWNPRTLQWIHIAETYDKAEKIGDQVENLAISCGLAVFRDGVLVVRSSGGDA